MDLKIVEKKLIGSEDSEKLNIFYECTEKDNQKRYWLDILVNGKETISYGFNAYEIFKIHTFIAGFFVKIQGFEYESPEDKQVAFYDFLGEKIEKFKKIIFSQFPYKDLKENWISQEKSFSLSDLNEFEIISFMEENCLKIAENAEEFYNFKAKKK